MNLFRQVILLIPVPYAPIFKIILVLDEDQYVALFKKVEAQQLEAEKENYSHRWTSEAIKLLLDTRLSMEEKFSNPTCKKNKLWDQISKRMFEIGKYTVSGTDCYGKYRNLLQTYRHNKEKRLKTTGESKITWEYFETFDQILGNKASSMPPMNILSSSIAGTDSSTLNNTEDSTNSTEKITDLPSTNRKKEKKIGEELSIGQYLYYKKTKDEEKWNEWKEIRLSEINALNNLADAIRTSANSGSEMNTVKEKKKSKRKYSSDSE